MAAFTLVVMTESSTYSPVPSFVDVDAHPTTETTRNAERTAAKTLCFFMIMLLGLMKNLRCVLIERVDQETLLSTRCNPTSRLGISDSPPGTSLFQRLNTLRP